MLQGEDDRHVVFAGLKSIHRIPTQGFVLGWLINNSIWWPFGVLMGDLTPCSERLRAGTQTGLFSARLRRHDDIAGSGPPSHRTGPSFQSQTLCGGLLCVCGGAVCVRCFQQQANWICTYCERKLWVLRPLNALLLLLHSWGEWGKWKKEFFSTVKPVKRDKMCVWGRKHVYSLIPFVFMHDFSLSHKSCLSPDVMFLIFPAEINSFLYLFILKRWWSY